MIIYYIKYFDGRSVTNDNVNVPVGSKVEFFYSVAAATEGSIAISALNIENEDVYWFENTPLPAVHRLEAVGKADMIVALNLINDVP